MVGAPAGFNCGGLPPSAECGALSVLGGEAPLAGFEPALPPPEGGALSPELQGLGVRTRGYPNGAPFLISGRGSSGGASLGLAGDPRPALRRHRRRPHRAGRGRHAAPARRRARRGGRGAPPEQGARRLRHQRRPAAGQEGGAGSARAGPVPGGRPGRDRGITTVDIAGPGFLNITVAAGAQGRSPPTWSPPARRTAAARPSPGPGSTWSSSPPTRPVRCTSATPGGPRSATRSPGSSTPPAPR